MTTKTTTRATIGQFMTHVPATVDEALTLADARDRMYANNLRHLPVTREGHGLVGLLSRRDIMVAIAVGGAPDKLLVSQAMLPNPFTCGPDSQLDEVAQEMEAHHYDCTIIVDDTRPIGVFTTTDALHALRQMLAGAPPEREMRPTQMQSPHTRLG